jgi:calcineurin-like phosphoesterase
MKILMIGDVYSSVGREMLQKYLPNIVKEHHIDFVIANVENISHGKGVQHKHYEFMQELGVDVMTSGNHVFKNKGSLNILMMYPIYCAPLIWDHMSQESELMCIRKMAKPFVSPI